MADATQKVTEEQANIALQQLTGFDAGAEEPKETPAPEPAAETPPATLSSTEEAAEPAAEAATEATPKAVETDDVQSLKKRLETIETERKREQEQFEKRLHATQERYQANERILRDRHLRKSSIADKALRTLRAVRTEAGVPEAEVDRIIVELQGTMNPDSASYTPPPESYSLAREDQAVAVNAFLNEKGMTADEADQFGKWVRGEAVTILTPQEQAVAAQSIDGFLRIAHTRWQTGLRETDAANQKKQADASAAVRATQRIQRAAASAATSPVASPKHQPASPKAPDLKKLSKDDISELLRQSVLHAND